MDLTNILFLWSLRSDAFQNLNWCNFSIRKSKHGKVWIIFTIYILNFQVSPSCPDYKETLSQSQLLLYSVLLPPCCLVMARCCPADCCWLTGRPRPLTPARHTTTSDTAQLLPRQVKLQDYTSRDKEDWYSTPIREILTECDQCPVGSRNLLLNRLRNIQNYDITLPEHTHQIAHLIVALSSTKYKICCFRWKAS